MVEGKQFLINQLKSMLNENTKYILIAEFDGGHDSGYVQMQDLGSDILFNSDYTKDDFRRSIETELNFGSFAGDFHANGEVYFNKDGFYVEGYQDYTTSESLDRDFEI